MMSSTKRVIAGILLTLLPLLSVNLAKQSAWGKFLATPKARQTGDSQARVSLIEYSDFQCPMCATIQPTLHQFLEVYKGKVRLAYKHLPLTKIHKNAMSAAHAAECAAGQDQFWPYQDRLFKIQAQWAPLTNPTSSYMALAQEIHLDIPKFTACLEDPSIERAIEQDRREAQQRQVTSTPTLFIGDQRLVGTLIQSDGARLIERELRK